jgi:hypothetical protein
MSRRVALVALVADSIHTMVAVLALVLIGVLIQAVSTFSPNSFSPKDAQAATNFEAREPSSRSLSAHRRGRAPFDDV